MMRFVKTLLPQLKSLIEMIDFKALRLNDIFSLSTLKKVTHLALKPVEKTSSYIGEHKNIAYHALAFDLTVAFFAIPIALFLRIGPEIVDYTIIYVFKLGFVYTLCCFGFYSLFNTHHVMWRYFDSDDALRFVVSVSLATVFFTPLKKLLSTTEELPRLTILIAWVITLIISLSPRFITFFQHHKTKVMLENKVSLLIFGTDDRTEVFLKQIQQMDESEYNIVGLISPRSDEIGLEIHHTNVVTSVKEFPKWLERYTAPQDSSYKLLIIEKDPVAVEKLLLTARAHNIQALKVPKSLFFEEWTDLVPFPEISPTDSESPATKQVA